MDMKLGQLVKKRETNSRPSKYGVIEKCLKWIEKVTNEAVLSRVKKKKRQLWHSIKVRRDKIIGHIYAMIV
jgi:hypothetical protein